MYSQSEEEKYILEFFKDKKPGRLLEIGAYHPTVFSNSRALIELGWSGVLVEPSPKCFPTLADFYKDNENIYTVQVAIGLWDGKLKFYDSAGANATAYEEHYAKWKAVQLDYVETTLDCVSWNTFYNNFPGPYDFISIDCEGMDWDILQQIDLNQTNTKLVCIEYGYNKDIISAYLQHYNFELLFMNGENFLAGRD
jgi:FkbM family methyltransferase